MRNGAALVSAMKMASVMLLILDTGADAASAMRGFDKTPHPNPGLTSSSAVPEKSSAPDPSRHLRRWLLSAKAAGPGGTTRVADGAAAGTLAAGAGSGRARAKAGTGGPDKRAQMQRVIAALEELHRTLDSTLGSRITIMPRGNGRNSGRKNKVSPAADEGGPKPTTPPPAAVDSTASRASAGVVVPSLTGRTFRKSLPPQTRRTNKRVCFWKYCSQN